MDKRTVSVLLGCWLCGITASARADFAAEVGAASEKVMPLLTEASAMLVDGRFDDANQKIMAVFPEKTRSAAQAFVLANVLYSQNPKASYELHKRAAHDLPDEPQVQYEWAMEQHRAGEYAGAAASYAVFSKAQPKYAPAYGLCAECLLRTGKTKEAVAMWKNSEAAPQGTLIELEVLVCSVNSHLFPDRQRADLMANANGGDIGAAEKLVLLDCAFESDWWNKSTKRGYLKHDLRALRATKFADTARLNEILCAGDCAMKRDDDGAAIGELLHKQGYFVLDHPKVPQNGAMLAIMLGKALLANVVSVDEVKTKFGPLILDRARATNDVETWRVAAALAADEKQSPEIYRLTWTATGDVGFATPLLMAQYRLKQLKLDDSLLTAASQKYPNDATLAGLVVALTEKAKNPNRAAITGALVNAIEAEYSGFSSGSHAVGVDLPRPGAGHLAIYFARLGQSLGSK